MKKTLLISILALLPMASFAAVEFPVCIQDEGNQKEKVRILSEGKNCDPQEVPQRWYVATAANLLENSEDTYRVSGPAGIDCTLLKAGNSGDPVETGFGKRLRNGEGNQGFDVTCGNKNLTGLNVYPRGVEATCSEEFADVRVWCGLE